MSEYLAPVIAAEIFGRTLPNLGFGLALVVLMAAFLLINRSSPGVKEVKGTGMMHQCKRCGAEFHPERSELLESGDVRRSYNDKCPKCGWDMDRGDPDNKAW